MKIHLGRPFCLKTYLRREGAGAAKTGGKKTAARKRPGTKSLLKKQKVDESAGPQGPEREGEEKGFKIGARRGFDGTIQGGGGDWADQRGDGSRKPSWKKTRVFEQRRTSRETRAKGFQASRRARRRRERSETRENPRDDEGNPSRSPACFQFWGEGNVEGKKKREGNPADRSEKTRSLGKEPGL